MKVVIIDWNSYGNIEPALVRRGNEVIKCAIDTHAKGEAMAQRNALVELCIKENRPDYVFSFNYFPFVSNICESAGVPYVSWIYDSPFMDLYSPSVLNGVNFIYVFDYGVYDEFSKSGIKTVHYLPLAVDISQYSELSLVESAKTYISDISFVGSLYSEPKQRLYDNFKNMSPYALGYLDSIVAAQKNIYGENIIEKLLTDEVIAEMEKCYPTDPNPQTIMTPRQIYSQYVLCRQVTSIERKEILELIGQINEVGNYRFDLFTHDEKVCFEGWENKGEVDYYLKMPWVFAASKINLNITLKSIRTGIPLRAFDIMAAGGFLLTNYQAEFTEYFVPDEDFVFYENYEDLIKKVKYYLEHDDERMHIALNGMHKVRNNHNYDCRLDAIESAFSTMTSIS